MIEYQLVLTKGKQPKLLGTYETKHVLPIPLNTQLAASHWAKSAVQGKLLMCLSQR